MMIFSNRVIKHNVHNVKKSWQYSRPQLECHKPNSPRPEIIKLFPARESLVSDKATEDGKITNLLFTVHCSLCWLGGHEIISIAGKKISNYYFCSLV